MNISLGDQVDLGSLTIGEKLGEGGYGTVYSAKHPFLDHPCAVKFLDPHPFRSKESRASERFEAESKLLLSLRHEYIAPIFGVGEHAGVPFILMERFEGWNLHQVKETNFDVTPQVVLPFVERIASALAYSHDKGIIHRDVKPTNLMTSKGTARVLDFGIAKVMDPGGERFTRTGGTPVGGSFTAPELLADPRLVNARCDVYSLGACWYWLLAGTAPQGRNWEASLRAVDGVTENYARVIFTTLNPADSRYASMHELLSDISSLKRDETPVARTELSIDAQTILGILFEQTYDSSGMQLYEIEKQTLMPRMSVIISIRQLDRLDLVEVDTGMDFGEEYSVYKISSDGVDWVETNRVEVESALRELEKRIEASKPKKVDAEDPDVPF
ncbi:serine/threonine-protein kinase [Aporhodopirellula aestuarii]|uniref:Serine/threonine protein kinase n=1 Tax=Aporhodopirellula aestuarii TaxID=2950107 RepID=A0ABT0U4R0_9BACT|nr:serine/threonine-protein kinase [Aporhodopirellula aestuarii]MCM2371894.1 serine/threonine protein kinase [Aporhodopirellula aestuarii]